MALPSSSPLWSKLRLDVRMYLSCTIQVRNFMFVLPALGCVSVGCWSGCFGMRQVSFYSWSLNGEPSSQQINKAGVLWVNGGRTDLAGAAFWSTEPFPQAMVLLTCSKTCKRLRAESLQSKEREEDLAISSEVTITLMLSIRCLYLYPGLLQYVQVRL